MPFVDTDRSLDDYLLGSFTDYLNIFCTVHDEVDFVVLRYLRDAIMKKVVQVSSLKKFIDMYKLYGLGLSFDVEFDDWLSWTANRSMKVNLYPSNHKEDFFYSEWKKVSNLDSDGSDSLNDKRVALNVLSKDILSMLGSLPDGDMSLIVVGNDGKYIYGRKLDKNALDSLLGF